MFDFTGADAVEIIGDEDFTGEKPESPTLFGPGRIERNDFDERLARFGDDEALPESGAIDEPRQVGFCFVDVHNFHGRLLGWTKFH